MRVTRRLLLGLLAMTACERSTTERAPPLIPMVPAAERMPASPCGPPPGGTTRFNVTPSDNNTECQAPSARHYLLRVRPPEGEGLWVGSVVIFPYYETREMQVYGLGIAGSMSIPVDSPRRSWSICEARAGYTPTTEVEFCLPPTGSMAVNVLVVYATVEGTASRVVNINGTDPALNALIAVRPKDGQQRYEPFEPMAWHRRGTGGDEPRLFRALHLPGTPRFEDDPPAASPSGLNSAGPQQGEHPIRL